MAERHAFGGDAFRTPEYAGEHIPYVSAICMDEILPGAPDTEQARTQYALKQGGTAK